MLYTATNTENPLSRFRKSGWCYNTVHSVFRYQAGNSRIRPSCPNIGTGSRNKQEIAGNGARKRRQDPASGKSWEFIGTGRFPPYIFDLGSFSHFCKFISWFMSIKARYKFHLTLCLSSMKHNLMIGFYQSVHRSVIINVV